MGRARWLAALIVLIAACSRGEDHAPAKPIPLGESRLAVPGGNIWYRVVGGKRGIPVVLLHGGPGFSSYYLKPLESLGDERIVVRYDQLGSGKSDTLGLADSTLFTTERFVAELDSLRRHLGIAKWHVLGHSWGTILAFEYYRAHPDVVASLVLGSPVLDFPGYERRANDLVATLSESSQRAIERAVAAGRFDSPEYGRAIGEFWGMYVFRRPVPADLDSLMATANMKIYEYMQGPSEFTITGTLKGYDAKPFLSQVAVPTLVMVGEFDEVGPELVQSHAALIPGARFELIPGSAHILTWDAPDTTVSIVRKFLREADAKGTTAAR